MIAGGEIRVHPNIRHDTVEHLKEDVCPGNPRNRASMRKKTGCEQSIDAKNPQTEAGRAVIAEAGRVCHSDAYRNVVQSSSECVNQTLTNASRMTAGGTGSQVFTGSRAERRTLFIDPNSIVHGSVGALNITTGASLEAVYNAANTVTPPPPPPP
ncbi:MAG: hypothetical protein HY609_05815, partial [Deltaproteobacteria bacterium]|nr:hypothetical protein [Deltaproteobacteria bacterium]